MSNLSTRTTTKRMSRPNMMKALNRLVAELDALIASSPAPNDNPRIRDATRCVDVLNSAIYALWSK